MTASPSNTMTCIVSALIDNYRCNDTTHPPTYRV